MHHQTLHPRRSLALCALFLASSAASMTHAETLTGKLNGLSCAERGQLCPTRNIDAHLSLEQDFVLQEVSGEYWLLSNVPRDVKVRHVPKIVRITGAINRKYRSVEVQALAVREGAEFETVWTPAGQQQAFEAIYHDGWFASGSGGERR